MNTGRLYLITMMAALGLAVATGCKSQRAVDVTHIPKKETIDNKKPGDSTPGGGNTGGGLGNGNTGGGNGDPVVTTNNNNPPNPDPNPNPNPKDDRNRDLSNRPGNYIEDREMLKTQAVHFDYDSAVMRPVDNDKVALVARYLQAQPGFYVLIEGHCDERGTEQYNLSLGQRRAQSVRDTLMKFGINPERVQTISFGEKVPVIESNDEVSYRENRRGEFVVYRPSLQPAPKPKAPVIAP